jgi:hypothetical protein
MAVGLITFSITALLFLIIWAWAHLLINEESGLLDCGSLCLVLLYVNKLCGVVVLFG